MQSLDYVKAAIGIYDPADEVEWAYMMRELGYEGELFLLFEEGRGGLYGTPSD